MTSRYHPYRHRRPRYRGKRHYAKIRLRWKHPTMVFTKEMDAALADMAACMAAEFRRILIREALTPLDTPG